MNKEKNNKSRRRIIKYIVVAIGAVIFLIISGIIYLQWSLSMRQEKTITHSELVDFRKEDVQKRRNETIQHINERFKKVNLKSPSVVLAGDSLANICYVESDRSVLSFKKFKACYIRKTLIFASVYAPGVLKKHIEERLKEERLEYRSSTNGGCTSGSIASPEGRQALNSVTLDGALASFGSLRECKIDIEQVDFSYGSHIFEWDIQRIRQYDEQKMRQDMTREGLMSFTAIGQNVEYFNEVIQD